jgi:subtilisin family serine protease
MSDDIELSKGLYDKLNKYAPNVRFNVFNYETLEQYSVRKDQLYKLHPAKYQYDSYYTVGLYGTESQPVPKKKKNRGTIETRMIPSHDVVNALLDVPTTLTGKGVKVGVIDTGIRDKTGQFDDLTIQKVKGWSGADWHGHGTHIASLIGGDAIQTPYGTFEGVAPEAQIISIKAFDATGFTTASTVIEAMQYAVDLGCKVINISSGSRQYDDVFNLAEHRVMQDNPDVIFVSSAGNLSENWTITSPALSPMAICVGSISIIDRELSHFSSRGPQGEWYRDNPDVFKEHLEIFGDDLIKPDCVAFGGGRANKNTKPAEVIGASMSGWFEGFYDGKFDNFGGAQGTSQAAALVSGLSALLVEGDIIDSASDFKAKMKNTWDKPKSPLIGYGLPVLSRFL